MRSPQSALRELRTLSAAGDAHALRVILAEHAEWLEGALGLGAPQLQHLGSQPDGALCRDVAQLVSKRCISLEQAARAEAQLRSREAADALRTSARWTREAIWLDAAVLFGPLLADRSTRLITFDQGDTVIAVRRQLLARARLVLRRFPVLTARVDSAALRIRWQHGDGCRGGLNLVSQPLRKDDEPHVLRVPLQRAPDHARSRGAWLGEVLSELGFPL